MPFFHGASNLFRYALSHPMGRKQPIATISRILNWQIRSRLNASPQTLDWIHGAKLVVERGMSGATGNIYFGLHEFGDMAFMLHFLRPGDFLLDIGANVGTYTVLAGKICQAQVMAFEPEPTTASKLQRNIEANEINALARIERYALGREAGSIGFTAGLDAMNHVATSAAEADQTVPIKRLDDVIFPQPPIMIKIDVEGHEDAAFEGAEQTLADPALLAIEAETVSDSAHQKFLDLGFRRHYYDPVGRNISLNPVEFPANNRLYIRNSDQVQDRVSSSVPIDLFGWKI